jgi:isopenicillin-N epimerase
MNFDLEEFASAWKLDPEVHHINHGSFGAVPTVVQAAQRAWQERVQFNPVKFFARDAMPAVQFARSEVAKFLGQRAEQIALVRNTTEASSTTMRGFPFQQGDEAIVLDHEYGAVSQAVQRAVIAAGGIFTVLEIPRLANDQLVVDTVEKAFTSNTRMFVVDHITSATARTFPIQKLSELCKSRGIAIVIDASHAPGNIDTDLDKLDADFWFGNLHKWASAPLGVGVFRIGQKWQEIVRPLIVSWQDTEAYPLPWDMLGTVDLSAWLTAPSAIDFYAQIGWDRVRKANSERMRYGRDLVMAELGIPGDQLREEDLPLGVVPLLKVSGGREGCISLQRKFAEEYKIEVPITCYGNNEEYFMRISGQLYNKASDYEALVLAVRKELV